MSTHRCLTYKGYKIEGKDWIDDKELALLCACYWMVDNRATIRQTAENCNFARSTLDYKIHKKLKFLCPDLYQAVCHQMKENMKRWGGNHK